MFIQTIGCPCSEKRIHCKCVCANESLYGMPLSQLKTVFHLEDEVIIAMDVDDTLRSANVAEVVHFTRCADAMKALETLGFDAAILDAAVSDGSTAKVAARLKELHIPFLIYTGSPEFLEQDHGGAPCLMKPVSAEVLINEMQAALALATIS